MLLHQHHHHLISANTMMTMTLLLLHFINLQMIQLLVCMKMILITFGSSMTWVAIILYQRRMSPITIMASLIRSLTCFLAIHVSKSLSPMNQIVLSLCDLVKSCQLNAFVILVLNQAFAKSHLMVLCHAPLPIDHL